MKRGESLERAIERAREFLRDADSAANGGNDPQAYRVNLARAMDAILTVIERDGEIQTEILSHISKPLWRRLTPKEWAFLITSVVGLSAAVNNPVDLFQLIAGVMSK